MTLITCLWRTQTNQAILEATRAHYNEEQKKSTAISLHFQSTFRFRGGTNDVPFIPEGLATGKAVAREAVSWAHKAAARVCVCMHRNTALRVCMWTRDERGGGGAQKIGER